MSTHPEPEPADEMHEDDQELARRLRGLDWPKPPAGLRERSLQELQEVLEREEPAPARHDD
jgi:hypothetical protein